MVQHTIAIIVMLVYECIVYDELLYQYKFDDMQLNIKS